MSLLDQAKAQTVRLGKRYNQEELLELAMAYVRGDVVYSQIKATLATNPTATLGGRLLAAARSGEVKVTRVKRKGATDVE